MQLLQVTQASTTTENALMNTHYTSNGLARSPSSTSINNITNNVNTEYLNTWKDKISVLSEVNHLGTKNTPILDLTSESSVKPPEKRALT